MVLGMLALLAAIWAGLVRLGWQLPPLRPALPIAHGPLMVSGFLGTVITLERAVALRHRWMYAAPALTGLGALTLIADLSVLAGPLFITLGSLGLVAIFVVIIRRQTALFTVTMGLGALAWLTGNALWLAGWSIPRVVLWWAGFLVLTIVGERLELSRLLNPPPGVRMVFLGGTGLFGAGLVISLFDLGLGMQLAGLGMIALALWLGRFDIARRTVRKAGLTRFVAVCLLSGYVWLGVSGLLALVQGEAVAGPRYDATLHTLFLGFVFSMIFGHALIIFPAVMGVSMHFRPALYFPLALLHGSLVLRLAGDLPARPIGLLRLWGGALNAVAILLFLFMLAVLARSREE